MKITLFLCPKEWYKILRSEIVKHDFTVLMKSVAKQRKILCLLLVETNI